MQASGTTTAVAPKNVEDFYKKIHTLTSGQEIAGAIHNERLLMEDIVEIGKSEKKDKDARRNKWRVQNIGN